MELAEKQDTLHTCYRVTILVYKTSHLAFAHRSNSRYFIKIL